METGYIHPDYANSLDEFGRPCHLPRCGGWLLSRTIPESTLSDAMGCYPLFLCKNWSGLKEDLNERADDWVSVSLVTDPFGGFNPSELSDCFPDVTIPFKKHYVLDLSQPFENTISKHHLRYALKALKVLNVERCTSPEIFLSDWIELYSVLTNRFDLIGIHAFSEMVFARQLKIPGMEMFRAVYQEKTVSILLWYVQDSVVYYHLGASSLQGYEFRASFALFYTALEYFSQQPLLHWVNLGASAGLTGDEYDGLSRFKKGWSSGTRIAYLCGRIFNRKEYDRICRSQQNHEPDYFPAYRKGEFKY